MKKPIREFTPLSLSPLIIFAIIFTICGTIYFGIFPSKIIAFAQQSAVLY
ncbi:MAG: hypothetical protein HN862_02945 [Candidatus Scalindua sp.]|nr:hypothetical protein [Candidatus Scalindua sp.]